MPEPDMHSYEPRHGHGLAHDPFNAIIGPRPIGWIGSRGSDGSVNLAPYSFFNAFNYRPPILAFSSTTPKDSTRNCIETREFTWNLCTRAQAEAMNRTSAPASYGTDEFALAGLEAVPSHMISAPRVGGSPVHFECRVTEVLHLHDQHGTELPAVMVFGEVVMAHIDRRLLKDGTFDTFAADIVLRAGGPTAYAALGPASRFDMTRPE